jgi:hypothetical protein
VSLIDDAQDEQRTAEEAERDLHRRVVAGDTTVTAGELAEAEAAVRLARWRVEAAQRQSSEDQDRQRAVEARDLAEVISARFGEMSGHAHLTELQGRAESALGEFVSAAEAHTEAVRRHASVIEHSGVDVMRAHGVRTGRGVSLNYSNGPLAVWANGIKAWEIPGASAAALVVQHVMGGRSDSESRRLLETLGPLARPAGQAERWALGLSE